MVEKSKRNLVLACALILMAVWLIFSRSVWDFAARLLLDAVTVPIIWALLKKEKNRLTRAITLLVFLVVSWLIWMENVSILHVLPLFLFAVINVKWALTDETRSARLLEFFVKTFTLFFIVVSVAYFVVWLSLTAPHTYTVYAVHVIFETGMVFVLPICFLLEAVSIVIFGIFKIKLKAWEIFLSSWYVSLVGPFGILAIYYALFPMPYTPPTEEAYWIPGSASLGAGMATLFTFVMLSFLPAAICAIIYMKFKKPQIEEPA